MHIRGCIRNLLVVSICCSFTVTRADVFNMPIGQTSLQFVTVGDIGNPADSLVSGIGQLERNCGNVGYFYHLGKFEVTAGQYTQFLNAVAASDPYGLYNPKMGDHVTHAQDRLFRDGTSGNYTYSIDVAYANLPVRWVSWGDAARFANWLTNGQPIGNQDLTTTEDGSYFLNGAVSSNALALVTRSANPAYVIPTEDEWYKAAYYHGFGQYYLYPTASNSAPTATFPPGGGNAANCQAAGGLTVVGAYLSSDSPLGTFDQAGNVWEWTEAIVFQSNGVYRGGGAGDTVEYTISSYRGGYDIRTAEDFQLGFRMAYVAVPEPCGFVLISCCAIFLLHARGKLWLKPYSSNYP